MYYTSARANADFDTRLATKDTGDLAEGTNLYYTNARADARIANNILDEDNFASDSATALATQQSIKAFTENLIAQQDLDIAPDSGTAQSIILPSETLTISGGSGIASSATSNTVTLAIDSVVTLTGSQTLTNKTLTSPTINALTFASGTSTSGMNIGANGIVFEGATADAHETTLNAEDPTQDNTITIPNSTMTAITTATHATQAVHIARAIALG